MLHFLHGFSWPIDRNNWKLLMVQYKLRIQGFLIQHKVPATKGHILNINRKNVNLYQAEDESVKSDNVVFPHHVVQHLNTFIKLLSSC